MSTIYILWLRQVKKYFRTPSRIVGSLGQPLLFLLVFGFGLGSVFQQAGQGDYIQFLSPGIIMMSVLFTALFSGIDLIWDRQFGFLKETMVAPVPRWHIMFGQALGGATVASFQGLIVFLLSLIIGFRVVDPLLLPVAVLIIFIVAMLFAALGISIASLLEDMQGFQLIMNFLVMPIFFLSGAFFPLEGLPKALEVITRIDPLTYGIDGLRHVLSGSGTFGMGLDLLIIVVIAALVLGVGSYLFERIQA
ncbi:MAG: multidrug ABC transporter permease [Dehalococcoidia bacterium]|nr:MAG: multidrug ABC transporter permease [Dehalococcoidia bacterium]